jgi:transcriptional regulator with XRE-family HTH domain
MSTAVASDAPGSPPPTSIAPPRSSELARLGRLVLRARKRLGLSQRGLDRMLGFSHGTTYRVEAGTGDPGLAVACRYIGALGIDFDVILHGERGVRGARSA